jgi:hypothetical protein
MGQAGAASCIGLGRQWCLNTRGKGGVYFVPEGMVAQEWLEQDWWFELGSKG